MPANAPPLSTPDPQLISALRERIRQLERGDAAGSAEQTPLSLGAAQLDAALPWGGLPRAALHEIVGDDGAGPGFAAHLAARLAADGRPILWCRRRRDLYGPGLAALGLAPERMVLVRARTEGEILWAMEEGLRSGCLAAVLGEVERIAPIAARRLQLAAEAEGVSALLLRNGRDESASCPAVTRWRVGSVASGVALDGSPRPRWRLDLLRCRNGMPRSWVVERNDDTKSHLVVVADLCDRPAAPVAAPVGTGGHPALRLAG